jgi:hypothetical protein
MSTTTKCLYCGKKVEGRPDKKFCSPEHRNLYNNKLNSDATNYMRNVNNALRSNRRVLQEFYLLGEKVTKEDLDLRGFRFQLMTSQEKGITWVYDYGYQETGGKYKIFKK